MVILSDQLGLFYSLLSLNKQEVIDEVDFITLLNFFFLHLF